MRRNDPFYKRISIPSEVPIGAVIGRKGSVVKALQEEFNCNVRVDPCDRVVAISSSSMGALKPLEGNVQNIHTEFQIIL